MRTRRLLAGELDVGLVPHAGDEGGGLLVTELDLDAFLHVFEWHHLLHAPLFAESREQRDLLMEMGSIREVLDLARNASVSIVGIGSIHTPGSSYFDLHPGPDTGGQLPIDGGVTGEFLAHLILRDGSVANYPLNSRIVALSPAELANCPVIIGVASGEEKVEPICAALEGRLFNSLIIDEQTAAAVLQNIREGRHVA